MTTRFLCIDLYEDGTDAWTIHDEPPPSEQGRILMGLTYDWKPGSADFGVEMPAELEIPFRRGDDGEWVRRERPLVCGKMPPTALVQFDMEPTHCVLPKGHDDHFLGPESQTHAD